MIGVPPVAAVVTIPVAGSMFAIPVAVDDHTPPDVASVSVVPVPAHIYNVPVMVAGTSLTVTTALAVPQLLVYVMIAVPDDKAVTTPVALLMLATTEPPFDQVPPLILSLSVRLLPTQIAADPVMTEGTTFTVTGA